MHRTHNNHCVENTRVAHRAGEIVSDPEVSGGGTEDDTLAGDDGQDILLGGGGGNDELYGEQQDDVLMGGTGDDTIRPARWIYALRKLNQLQNHRLTSAYN